LIDLSEFSVYRDPEESRKPEIVEKSPVFVNFKINFSNLSENGFPERFFIYPGTLKDSRSSNSHG
jgi:hypothetical protein